MTSQPSGWYNDPDDDTQLRYWDGILWTERRMPKTKPNLESSTLANPRPAEPAQPGTGALPGTPGAPQQGPPGSSPTRPGYPPNPVNQHQRQGGSPYETPPQQPGGWSPAGQQGFPGYPQPAPGPRTPDGQLISGWWRRAGAYLIDNILINTLTVLVTWPWISDFVNGFRTYFDRSMQAAESGGDPPPIDSMPLTPWQLLVGIVVVYAIYDIGFTAWRGRTPGKFLTGISVRPWDRSGVPSIGQAGRRFAIKSVPQWTSPVPGVGFAGMIFFFVDSLWPLGDQRNQSLHDRFAGTVVVRGAANQQATQQDSSAPPFGPPLR